MQPATIVDLGCGCGLYGCIARNYLDGREGRVRKPDWRVGITGVEGFDQYANPMWGAYDFVLRGDFRLIYETITGYDLVLMIDSLEHVEKAEALAILYHLALNNKNVIVSVPVGACPQGTCFGNDLETHRSTWSGPQEFAAFNYRVLYQGICCVVSIHGVKT